MTPGEFFYFDVFGQAKGGFHKGYLQVIPEIRTPPGRSPRAGAAVAEAEDIAEDIAETAEDVVETGEALEPGTAQSFMAVLIVNFPLLRVA